MKKKLTAVLALTLACVLTLSLCACGKAESFSSAGQQTESGETVWYLGGNNIMSSIDDVESVFANVPDTIDAAKIYGSLEYTEEMLHGAYTLNEKEKDLKRVRKEIPIKEVQLKSSTLEMTILPTSVIFGAENIANSLTNYTYGEFEGITDNEIAVIFFATADKQAKTVCTYEVNGRSITFKQIEQTSAEGAPFTYGFTGVEWQFDFAQVGPYMTFSKDDYSLQLTAYCFTKDAGKSLSMTGYSLPETALIGDLDYFASADTWNYAVRRDGSYYDLSAYKLTSDGKFTCYLAERDLLSGEVDATTEQYAYIVQSSASAFFTDFSIILTDGQKLYYYTDDITQREARMLADQGVDVNGLTEDDVKEIAEKKADLFDDLQKEFEAQGINITINRSTGEIVMDASVLFGGDSAEMRAEGKELLNKFLTVYTSVIYNEKYAGFISKTLVEGHTAPVSGSTYESGLPLSQERADNVKNYCLSAETGVDTSKLEATLEAVGMSNSKPIYGSDGEIDMAACRRVSFRFVVDLTAYES